MVKAFRYRIYPSDEQKNLIRKFIGSSRFVYNHFLALRSSTYKETGQGINYYGASARLTKLKKEISWLKEADKFALQNTLRDLEDAYGRFFKKKISIHGLRKSMVISKVIGLILQMAMYKFLPVKLSCRSSDG